jgi:hypothetical protein
MNFSWMRGGGGGASGVPPVPPGCVVAGSVVGRGGGGGGGLGLNRNGLRTVSAGSTFGAVSAERSTSVGFRFGAWVDAAVAPEADRDGGFDASGADAMLRTV